MRRRLTRASLIVVLLVLGGGVGGAVGAGLVTGAQIKDGSVTGADIVDRGLTGADFARDVSGPRGPAGPPGTAGGAGTDAEAGYSWVVRVNVSPIPPQSSKEFTVTCPAGSTVLGGSANYDTPLDVLDSSKVPGQEAWHLHLGNVSNSSVDVTPYAWCAGLTNPTLVTS